MIRPSADFACCSKIVGALVCKLEVACGLASMGMYYIVCCNWLVEKLVTYNCMASGCTAAVHGW